MREPGNDGPVAGPDRSGAALAFVVLVMLGLLTLAHGALIRSLSERAASHSAVRDLEVRAAAEVGVRRTLTHPPGPWMDSTELGAARPVGAWTVGPVEVTGSLRRLAPESWLVTGTGRRGSGAEARGMRLVWSLDPVERVKALQGAVSVGSEAVVSIGGTIEGSAPAAVEPPLQLGDCAPWLAWLIAYYAAASLTTVAPLPDGAAEPALGLLDFDDVLVGVQVRVSGAGTPAPVERFGACLEDEPWSWGDPDQPWRPCGAHLSLRGAEDDVRVDGGVGQGLLVVDGDVTFDTGARYYGLVIARGALRLQGGAVLEGMALAGRGLLMDPGTSLRASACWAVRALAAYRAEAARLVPLTSVGRIGPV